MKAGPVLAMIGLLVAGVWMVLQPTLEKGKRIDPTAHRFVMELGAEDVYVEQRRIDADTKEFEYHFVGDEELEAKSWVDAVAYAQVIDQRLSAWQARPTLERTLLGFFNITSWGNFAWVAIGLGGQIAFFGRMLVQWIVSEKRRESVVPPIFWWLSFIGGAFLFSYFVWRTDIVGVLGQSTGVVVYARNLRLIGKQRRRDERARAEDDDHDGEPETGEQR